MNNIGKDRRMTRHGMWPLIALTMGMVGLVLSVSSHTWEGDADGARLFKTYCASCHGAEATGNGPMARALRHAPADLTQIAKSNGGMFPTDRVHRIIAGREIESHGDREMPVWGDAFTTAPQFQPRDGADTRIAAIVRYLESIQQRAAQ
jgi:mono/diheme cytochrome c family protein